ncbi:UbiA family prenyltransferase [Streptomyces klenkii]
MNTHSLRTHTPGPRPARRAVNEVRITTRLLADNLQVHILPPLVFGLGVCLRAQLPAHQILRHLGEITVLFLLYGYVFDISNQARGAEEDRLNKPYRPIPSGLLTPVGAMRRFWIAMPLYTLLGWHLGVVEWVLLWQADVLVINLLCRPRTYLWCKPPCMMAGTLAQLTATWQTVSPLDSTAWRWITFITVLYPLALVYEDIRDMAGDRTIGRRTPALVLGPRPIRIWFAGLLTGTPVLAYLIVFAPTGASAFRTTACGALFTAICWTCATRALLLRRTAADRLTYQLFILSYALYLAAGVILWA